VEKFSPRLENFFAKACHRGQTVCQGWEIFSPRLAGQALAARGKIFAKAGSCLGSPWKNFRQGLKIFSPRHVIAGEPSAKAGKFFAKACHRGRTVRQGWEIFSPRLAGQALVARGKIFAKAGSCLGSPWKIFRQGLKIFSPRHVIAGEPSAKAGKFFRQGWPVRPW